MFKKRPRQLKPISASEGEPSVASKMDAGYWQRRLFKNTFTYKGRSRQVNGWSVKIQLFGKRKTFSLCASDTTQAAVEACQIYQTINSHGWEAVEQQRGKLGARLRPAHHGSDSVSTIEFSVDHWKSRLINRRYPEPLDQTRAELSARIEHSGISRYFPLGTHEEDAAASQAKRIHQAVIEQGWAVTGQKFRRELTLAFRWLDDPLAWTYTTLHTWQNDEPVPTLANRDSKSISRNVAIIEPDAGIRFALASNVNSQDGFQCCATYANIAEALREITRRKTDVVLSNYALPDQPGSIGLETLQQSKASIVGLLYSVFEDSDELFRATPGGAAGYMLKRTPAHRIFDPLSETTNPLTRETIAIKIREYFQRLVAAMPSGPSALSMAKLTPREHEILALLAKGDLAKEIAETLGISIWTVNGHVKSIFEKLNVHTRTEAVVKFLQK